MDYNLSSLGFGYAMFENQIEQDKFSNLTDDEKKEYIERNRSALPESTIDRLTASIVEDEDDGPNFDMPSSLFKN